MRGPIRRGVGETDELKSPAMTSVSLANTFLTLRAGDLRTAASVLLVGLHSFSRGPNMLIDSQDCGPKHHASQSESPAVFPSHVPSSEQCW